ncbi:hypothetical protein CALVIDRAFT_134090 [Calocera viscosa TUFC12733]|uniref:Uncharacterized protein n=1 Tax=Calocera viscosa (strain TUFC12733) TaxID=1330018 RepID=A0A167LWW6_CALVF|nr:hypothetical protein CALVIDRAFT_134090 [Calocera viscosa TUFC12733]
MRSDLVELWCKGHGIPDYPSHLKSDAAQIQFLSRAVVVFALDDGRAYGEGVLHYSTLFMHHPFSSLNTSLPSGFPSYDHHGHLHTWRSYRHRLNYKACCVTAMRQTLHFFGLDWKVATLMALEEQKGWGNKFWEFSPDKRTNKYMPHFS